MTSKREPVLEVIEWEDHCAFSYRDWRSVERISQMTPTVITSAGWLVKETRDHLILVAHFDRTAADGGSGAGDQLILKKVIKRRWKLKDPARARARRS